MSSKQFLFVMVKPDGVKRKLVGEIISRFEKKGFDLIKMEMRYASEELVMEHYKEHSNKGFFRGLVDFSISGPVISMIWNGDVQVARKMVGATIPWQAENGTIRGDYAVIMRENLVHCSDSTDSAQREVELWFPELKS